MKKYLIIAVVIAILAGAWAFTQSTNPPEVTPTPTATSTSPAPEATSTATSTASTTPPIAQKPVEKPKPTPKPPVVIPAPAPTSTPPVVVPPTSTPPGTISTPTSTVAVPEPIGTGITAYNLNALVNAARIRAGLAPLKTSAKLESAASMKAQDMISKGYFAHTDPNNASSTPWYWFGQAGYAYSYAGENLAGPKANGDDYNTAQEVVDAWLASPGHRANIMNVKFTETGIAVVQNIRVQMFGSPAIPQ